jgi:hypothetical protein
VLGDTGAFLEQFRQINMRTTFTVLFMIGIAFVAHGRPIQSMSYPEMIHRADLVVIAKPVSTTNTAEKSVLPDVYPNNRVIGVDTEFAVRLVTKGDNNLKKLVLHHFRLANPDAPSIDGPMLASFDPSRRDCFLLFLHRDSDGRYSPVTGQTDPDGVSVIKLPVGWDCTVLQGDDVKLVPHGLKQPLLQFVASNTNVSFVKDPGAPQGTKSPVIPLYFYRQTEKAEIMKIIEKESVLSWNIPVYFGETDEFVVVTSPAYVNGGVFTPEARRALHPMWQVLRDVIPNRENTRVDELAADN